MDTTRQDPTTERLPQELTEFLLEFALALQRHGMYPGGHPSLDAAVEALSRRLATLLRDRPVLSLGIARRQLVVEGVATDSRHPVLRVFSERLHRHRLGAVALRRGIGASELHSFLHAVASDPDREGAVGQTYGERQTAWPHVGLYPITYEQLQLAASEPDDEPAEGDGSGTAAAQLWIGLAQAALARAGRTGGTAPDEPPSEDAAAGSVAIDENTDPAEVARAINEHDGAQGYDQMIVGYMLQLAGELRRDGGTNAGVRRRVSQLIRQLEPRTLQRLLHMGGDLAQRSRFLLEATESLGTDAMLDLLRAAATAQQQDISTSLVRMLRKMSTLAEHAGGSVAAHADAQLREQVKALIEGWSLADPNPDAYTQALHGMTGERAAAVPVSAVDGSGAPCETEPMRIVQMALEVGVTGPVCARAIDTLLVQGRQAELFELLDLAGQEGTAAQLLWQEVGTREHVERMFAAEPVDFDMVDQLLVRLPGDAVLELMLDGIAASESRTTRMGLFVRIAAFGAAAVPHIMPRLADERWYVVRNMLALLNEIGAWPDDFSPLSHARHEQPMVRREALQLAARLPAERDQAIALALSDQDERAMRAGVNAAREGGVPGSAVRLVLRRLEEPDLPADLRASLIRMLDGHGSGVIAARLVDLALQRRRFRRPRLAPKSPEMLAALWVLAGMRAAPPAAARALTLARAAGDAQIREAVER